MATNACLTTSVTKNRELLLPTSSPTLWAVWALSLPPGGALVLREGVVSHSLIPFLPGDLSKSLEGSVACGRVREGALSSLPLPRGEQAGSVRSLPPLVVSAPFRLALAEDTGISTKARSGSKAHLGWTGQRLHFLRTATPGALFLQFGAFAHAVPSAWHALPIVSSGNPTLPVRPGFCLRAFHDSDAR